jgi:hypothetical protein
MEPLLAELARIHEITAAVGTTLVCPFDHSSERGRDIRAIPLVDPLPLFEARNPGEARFRRSQSDFHWSSEARDLAAAELARALHEEGLLSGQEATLE